MNGDGYDDLVVGAYGFDMNGFDVGKVYVYHGSPAGLGEDNRPADWSAVGENEGDYFGSALGTAGDVNGDGKADLVVGAFGNDEKG